MAGVLPTALPREQGVDERHRADRLSGGLDDEVLQARRQLLRSMRGFLKDGTECIPAGSREAALRVRRGREREGLLQGLRRLPRARPRLLLLARARAMVGQTRCLRDAALDRGGQRLLGARLDDPSQDAADALEAAVGAGGRRARGRRGGRRGCGRAARDRGAEAGSAAIATLVVGAAVPVVARRAARVELARRRAARGVLAVCRHGLTIL